MVVGLSYHLRTLNLCGGLPGVDLPLALLQSLEKAYYTILGLCFHACLELLHRVSQATSFGTHRIPLSVGGGLDGSFLLHSCHEILRHLG